MGAVGGLGTGVEDDGADALAEGGVAGVAEGGYDVAGGFEEGGETAELGGLAGAVETFKADENNRGT